MRFRFISIFCLSLVIVQSFAQQNADSIFTSALSMAKNKQFPAAIVTAKNAYNTDQRRADILVFIGNVYSWENKNDSALIYIGQARQAGYKHDDMYEAWTNVLLRSHQYDALLTGCDEAEKQNYSNRGDILKKRLIACTELQLYDKGYALMKDSLNKALLKSKEISNLYTGLMLKRNTNLLSAYYTLDMFNNGTTAQHLASIGYSFKTGKNNLGFGLNYANRYGLSDVQLESNFYLKLKHQQYMYFNYGYAFNATLFPRHRAGFEYYFPVTYLIEASLGARYMNYSTVNVFIATGHIGKYFGKNWISLRPFYVYNATSAKESFTLIGNYRIYGKNEQYYWGLELGYGNSPDEKYDLSQTGGFNQLKAYKVKLEKNFMLDYTSDLHLAFGYSREETGIVSIFRNRFTIELGYKLRLR